MTTPGLIDPDLIEAKAFPLNDELLIIRRSWVRWLVEWAITTEDLAAADVKYIDALRRVADAHLDGDGQDEAIGAIVPVAAERQLALAKWEQVRARMPEEMRRP